MNFTPWARPVVEKQTHGCANRMGIASAWIDRRHDKQGGGATALPDPLPHYDFRFTSLAELAEAQSASHS